MRIAVRNLTALGVGVLLIAGVLLAFEAVSGWWLIYLGIPVGLAVALVIARRYPAPQAAFAGALITLGIILLFVLPGLTYKWLAGDWASGPDCDGFCMSNNGGFVFALFILGVIAVPAAFAGGFIAGVASLAGVRPVAK